MKPCPKCGAMEWRLIEQMLHLQRFECINCGHVVESLLSPEVEESSVGQVQLKIVWEKRPTNFDVMGLKKLLPLQTEGFSITQLYAKILEDKEWDAGFYSPYHADLITQQAKELDLVAVMKPKPTAEP